MANLSDDLNRANETPASTNSWASDSAFQGVNLSSNAFGAGSNGSIASVSYRTDSANNYSMFQLANVSVTGYNDGGPAIHCDGAGAFYYASVYLDSGSYRAFIGLHQVSGWTTVYDSPAGFTPTTSMYLRLYRSGSNVVLDCWNGSAWVNITTQANSTLSTGNDGVFIATADDIKLDNWSNFDVFDTMLRGQACL